MGISLSNALANWSFKDFDYIVLNCAQGHWILFRKKATAYKEMVGCSALVAQLVKCPTPDLAQVMLLRWWSQGSETAPVGHCAQQ